MKILLVEDTRALAVVLTARLNSFGYEVLVAENGKVAIECFKQDVPDLILMDIEMPVMNGFEATSRIRAYETSQQWAWTPIIFLTASDSPDNLVTAIEAGADDFLSKSITEPVLSAKMKAMTRIAALRQRLSVANQKLYEQASRDGLTGLFNRRHMDAQTDLAWENAQRGGHPFAILMLDIDNFKKYNDHYGHQAGDDCLKQVAQAIARVVDAANAQSLTQGCFAARYGGEEFAVVVPAASEGVCERLAHAIIKTIRELNIAHEKNADWGIVTASIGGCRATVAEAQISNLFRSADAKLYQAKENGRNRAELNQAPVARQVSPAA